MLLFFLLLTTLKFTSYHSYKIIRYYDTSSAFSFCGGERGRGSIVHAINQLTHGRSCNIRYIFLVIFFFIICTRLKARANNEEKNDSKNISDIALEVMR